MLIPVTAADTPDFTAACAHEHIFGSRALTALRAFERSSSGLGSGAAIGIVASCVVVAVGAVTAGVLIGKKKKAKKDGE